MTACKSALYIPGRAAAASRTPHVLSDLSVFLSDKRIQRILFLARFCPCLNFTESKPSSVEIHCASSDEICSRGLVGHNGLVGGIKDDFPEIIQFTFEVFSSSQVEMGTVLKSDVTGFPEILKRTIWRKFLRRQIVVEPVINPEEFQVLVQLPQDGWINPC